MDTVPRVPIAALRLLLGITFTVAAVVWFFHTDPHHERILLTVAGRHLTRLDVAALPLLLAGVLLMLLAKLARHERPANAATAWLALAGVIGCVAAWWLSANPLGEGRLVAYLSRTHGVTESDLTVLPVIGVAAACGVAGLIALIRSSRPSGAPAGRAVAAAASRPGSDR